MSFVKMLIEFYVCIVQNDPERKTNKQLHINDGSPLKGKQDIQNIQVLRVFIY